MIRFVAGLVLALAAGQAAAHELVPTYPELKPSYVQGVLSTTLVLFNKREDIRYYEISVFDSQWNKLEFATSSRIIEVPYQKQLSFDVFVRSKDREKVTYICTESKLTKQQQTTTVVSSRICSKIK